MVQSSAQWEKLGPITVQSTYAGICSVIRVAVKCMLEHASVHWCMPSGAAGGIADY